MKDWPVFNDQEGPIPQKHRVESHLVVGYWTGRAVPASYWQKLLLQRSLPVGTLSALIVAQSPGGIEGCGAQ